MIRLVNALPAAETPSAEYVRIKCLFDSYNSDPDVYFWEQTGGETYISMADGNMTVCRREGNIGELKEFISFISPRTLFTDAVTFKMLNAEPTEIFTVMSLNIGKCAKPTDGDALSSRDIYEIFSAADLAVPDYPHFAVDFCRRLNRGKADFWGIKNKCAAVSFNTGNFALLNGIASLEKGMGGKTLERIIAKNSGRQMLLYCRTPLAGFYEKYGFKRIYEVALG